MAHSIETRFENTVRGIEQTLRLLSERPELVVHSIEGAEILAVAMFGLLAITLAQPGDIAERWRRHLVARGFDIGNGFLAGALARQQTKDPARVLATEVKAFHEAMRRESATG